MQTKIDLKIEERDNYILLSFTGDLDATNVDTVMDRIIELLNSGFVNVVADFKNLRYLNSTGLGMLLHLNKTARKMGGSFRIANVNENVYDIMDLVGATVLLNIYGSVDEAVSALANERV